MSSRLLKIPGFKLCRIDVESKFPAADPRCAGRSAGVFEGITPGLCRAAEGGLAAAASAGRHAQVCTQWSLSTPQHHPATTQQQHLTPG